MRTLRSLSEVVWADKRVASGFAVNVPQALAGLVSPDSDVRNRSYWQLDNEVVLQSDLFEAAYDVIPFLVQYLEERVTHGRYRIYDLLYEIGNGSAPGNVRCATSEGDEISLQEACHRELRRGLPVFRRDTADSDPLVSGKARLLVDLLGSDDIETNDSV